MEYYDDLSFRMERSIYMKYRVQYLRVFGKDGQTELDPYQQKQVRGFFLRYLEDGNHPPWYDNTQAT